jgi:Protein of unknown function (DUF3800)
MHFYYLDEAGCTGRDLQNREQPIFVLAGVSVRDEGWSATQERLANMTSDYFGGATPNGFELHAEELLSPNGDGPFAGHDRARRNDLAKQVLGLLVDRSHHVHMIGIDKRKLARQRKVDSLLFDPKVPFLLAYDYLITYIDWFLGRRLGRSARGMIILDAKPEFLEDVESITRTRRFDGPKVQRVKRIVEFSYLASTQNPMVQLSGLVAYCSKKFLELENGCGASWPEEAKRFYAECYGLIDARVARRELVERGGRDNAVLNDLLREVRSTTVGHWRRRYGAAFVVTLWNSPNSYH